MARSYAKLLVAAWRDADFCALELDVQRLYFLLLSQPDLSSAGVLPLRVSKWAKLAADTDAGSIEDALNALADKRYVIVDEDTEEVLIRSFIRHDGGFTNKNLLKSIESAVDNIESDALAAIAAEELNKAAGGTPFEGRSKGVETDMPREPEGNPNNSTSTNTLNLNHQQQQQPSESSSTGTRLTPAESAAAAGLDTTIDEAIELLVAHRLDTKKPDDEDAYARKIRSSTRTEHEATFAALTMDDLGTDPVRYVATKILGLTKAQAMSADFSRRLRMRNSA